MGVGEWSKLRRGKHKTQKTVEITMMPPHKDYYSYKYRVGASCLGGRFSYGLWPFEVETSNVSSIPFHSTKRQISLDGEEIVMELCDDHGLMADIVPRVVSHTFRRPCPAGIVFLYDTTSSGSWEDLKALMQSALEIGSFYSDGIKWRFMIVGCKCDLVEEREVDYVAVKEYAEERGMLFMETSAKENINVEYAFVSFAAQLLSGHAETL